jgi:hypothetical protein
MVEPGEADEPEPNKTSNGYTVFQQVKSSAAKPKAAVDDQIQSQLDFFLGQRQDELNMDLGHMMVSAGQVEGQPFDMTMALTSPFFI